MGWRRILTFGVAYEGELKPVEGLLVGRIFLQSRLLTWMSDSDRRQLNLNNQEEVVQKYVLHLFFHEMELYGWYNNTGCLTGSHEYAWFGTYY